LKGKFDLKERRVSQRRTLASRGETEIPILSAKRITAAVIAIAMAAVIAAAGCSGGGEDASGFGSRGAAPVTVAHAVRKTVAQSVHAIGRVEAYSTVQVKAQINGEVMAVHFKQGQDVAKGDLLFTIDPRPFEAALRQSEADLQRDKAQMAQAQADFDRYAFLLKEGVGSQQQYDEAKSKFESLKATVAADEANVQTAKLNLAYTQIRSPIDGRTGDLLLHPGNLVKANADTAMLVINQIKPVYVDFSLPEKDLASVRASMAAANQLKVDVTLPGVAQETIHGVLSFVDNTVDPNTGTIVLKGLFANTDERLWPGQFVDTRLTLSERPNAVIVPSQAVQTGQEGSYVFVIDPKMKAEMRKVVIGDTIAGETVIESGLNGGETVVTDGQVRLIPGMKVTIKNGIGAPQRAAS
jgi:multidrug efflux system membrane fusion protein